LPEKAKKWNCWLLIGMGPYHPLVYEPKLLERLFFENSKTVNSKRKKPHVWLITNPRISSHSNNNGNKRFLFFNQKVSRIIWKATKIIWIWKTKNEKHKKRIRVVKKIVWGQYPTDFWNLFKELLTLSKKTNRFELEKEVWKKERYWKP